MITSIPAFKKEGYDFIRNKCDQKQSDIFQFNLLVKKVICMTGAEAAELFYDSEKFKRKGAIPKRIQKTLTGENAIHSTDAAIHSSRKKLFMSVMTPESIAELADLTAENWEKAITKWEKQEEVILFKEVPEIICRAVCAWAGVPLKGKKAGKISQDLIAMVDAFGAVGPRHWRGKKARKRTEKWMEKFVKKVRSGKLKVPENSPLHLISTYTGETGELLDKRLAAIEVLNLVRPTVAITYYIAFAVHALKEHPEYREKIINDEDFTERFVNEVRRFYPIGPFLGAKVKQDFEWKGYPFPKDSLVLLDIYGTNKDSRYWEKPEEFWPDNFLHWSKSPFDFLPQGGGDHYNGHRCAGEWITIELMKVSLNFLKEKMDYKIPPQDLSYPLNRIPTYPKSGVVIKNVKRRKEQE